MGEQQKEHRETAGPALGSGGTGLQRAGKKG